MDRKNKFKTGVAYISRAFAGLFFVLAATAQLHAEEEVLLTRQVCINEAHSEFSHDAITASASDNSCSDTKINIEVLEGSSLGTVTFERLGGGPHTVKLIVDWIANARGTMKVRVSYQRRDWAIDGCYFEADNYMYTYVLQRGLLPGGSLTPLNPTTYTSSASPSSFTLNYARSTSYPQDVAYLKWYVNSQFQGTLSASIVGSDNYVLQYQPTAFGTYNVTTEVVNFCSEWSPGPSSVVTVLPSCAANTITSIVPTGTNVEANEDGSYFVDANQPYTLSINGTVSDIGANYDWISDGGGDIVFNQNTFTVNQTFGSYTIQLVPKPGKETYCPTSSAIQILVGRNMTLVEKACPIVVPDDLVEYAENSNDIIFEHFSVKLVSETSVTVMPGVTLAYGAELVVDLPTGDLANDDDRHRNFTESTVYDEYGRVLATSRNYFNDNGLIIQSQFQNIDDGRVLANATLYDALGRQAITTLSAPVASRPAGSECDQPLPMTFAFKDGFIRAEDGSGEGTNYKATHFDGAQENNPLPVFEDTPNTLGWYYSVKNDIEPYVAATNFPYSRTLFHHDGTGQVKSSTKPGDLFRAGGSYLTSSSTRAAVASDPYLQKYLEIRATQLLLPNGPIEGNFAINEVEDVNHRKSVSYVDKNGNEIISLYFDVNATVPLTKSYAFYDVAGRLIVSITPNGVASYERPTNENPVPFADIDKTTNFYNTKGQLVAVEEPDVDRSEPEHKGRAYFVYRKDGKIRFSENAKQRRASAPSYSYSNYDKSGRVIESGEYQPGTGGVVFKSPQMINILENTDADGGLANGTKKFVTKTHYDEPASNTPQSRVQRFLNGAVSYTENENVTTWYSYDERGRVEWIVQNILGLGVKTLDYRYGPTGSIQEVLYQKGQADQFTHYYEYNADGKITKAYTTPALLIYDKKGEVTNRGELTLQATYEYYLHGPLKSTVLGDNLQGIDYVYTADGALKSINNGSTNANLDPGKDGVDANTRKDVFGMSLEYFPGDYVSNASLAATGTLPTIPTVNSPERYDGLIHGIRWHGVVEPEDQFLNTFQYDNRYQFTESNWWKLNNLGEFKNEGVDNYRLSNNKTESYKEKIADYDLNGNIQNLARKNGIAGELASFKYVYTENTNRLDKIVAPGTNGALLRDYEYDEIGQLKTETGASTKSIEYDVSGKVTKVFRDVERTKLATSFSYDDRGFRVSKTTYDEQGTAKRRTWYVRDASGSVMATYEQDLVSSQPIVATEMPIYGSGRIGMYKPQFDFSLYEINDHVGNVRAVIGEELEVEYLATMESERLSAESIEQGGDFYKIRNNNIGTANNHTPAEIILNGETQTISDPDEVIRLNNLPTNVETATGPIGTGIRLMVHPGDRIVASVFAKYTDFNPGNQNIIPLAASLLNPLFNVTPRVDGSSLFSVVGDPSFSAWPAWTNKLDNTQPRAFLNYLLFDKDDNLQEFDFDQVSQAAKISAGSVHEMLTLEVTIKKEGFIYVFLSNHSNQNTEVYFDDLKVKQTYSDIVGGGDFYPFGLAISDRQIERDFYRHGYQGQFSEKDEETGWNHFELREYDPSIARWTAQDPEGQFFSPYVGMGNKPVNGADPDGGYFFGLFGSTYKQRRSAQLDAKSWGGQVVDISSKNIYVEVFGGTYLPTGPTEGDHFKLFTRTYYDKNGGYNGIEVDAMYWMPATGEINFDAATQLSLGFAALAVPATTARVGLISSQVGTHARRFGVNAGVVGSDLNLYWKTGALYNYTFKVLGTQYARNIVYATTVPLAPMLGRTKWGKGIAAHGAYFSQWGNINWDKVLLTTIDRGMRYFR
jgi:RHS repeat-associated protein